MEEDLETEFAEYGIPIEKTEKNAKLLNLIKQPWRLIREGGKLGVKGVKRFITNVFLFSIANLFLFFYAIYRLVSTEFFASKILIVIVVLILGIIFTFYAASRTYRYVMIDTVRVIYNGLGSFFQKISERIIDKVEPIFRNKESVPNEQLKKALDFGKMVNSKFRKTPKFLRKAIILILNRIPFVGMLTDLQSEITSGKKTEAGRNLYLKMDGFITESIFGNNHTRWVWWLLPLNILVQIVIIRWKIG